MRAGGSLLSSGCAALCTVVAYSKDLTLGSAVVRSPLEAGGATNVAKYSRELMVNKCRLWLHRSAVASSQGHVAWLTRAKLKWHTDETVALELACFMVLRKQGAGKKHMCRMSLFPSCLMRYG